MSAFQILQQVIPAVISLGQHTISEKHETQRHLQQNLPTNNTQNTNNYFAVVNYTRSDPAPKPDPPTLGKRVAEGAAFAVGAIAVTATAVAVGGAIVGISRMLSGGGTSEVPMVASSALEADGKRFEAEDVLFNVEVEEIE